jgi:hypothetical protein
MNLIIDILIFFSLLYYVLPKRKKTKGCGIPVANWLIIMATTFLIDALR